MIMLLGDVHAQHFLIKTQLEHAQKENKIDVIIQLGDFGIIESYLDFYKTWVPPVPIDFIDGNHEDFKLLENYGDSWSIKNVNHIKRGSCHIYSYLNDLKVIAVGGSEYMDNINTRVGAVFSDWDVHQAFIKGKEFGCDIVISHDAPSWTCVSGHNAFNYLGSTGTERLDQLKELKPKYWFFGHYHIEYQRKIEGIKYCCLPTINDGYGLLDTNFMEYQFIENKVHSGGTNSFLGTLPKKSRTNPT